MYFTLKITPVKINCFPFNFWSITIYNLQFTLVISDQSNRPPSVHLRFSSQSSLHCLVQESSPVHPLHPGSIHSACILELRNSYQTKEKVTGNRIMSPLATFPRVPLS